MGLAEIWAVGMPTPAMSRISRNPEAASADAFDVIIIGGGIYGTLLLLEAASRGLRALLLEKNDFGSATSYNSLRIIHGGLRYLQSLDLKRFYESVEERQWFLSNFPDLVKPLPCLMPLYSKGLKRPEVLRTALWLNDRLSASRIASLQGKPVIQDGRILSVAETRDMFPNVDYRGMTGAALWYDAHMEDSQRVIIESLRWACSLGAQAFNYLRVDDLLTQNNTVVGVRATDSETDQILEFRSNTVINATGPFARNLAAKWDREVPSLYRHSLLWNVLFDHPAPSDAALALTPEKRDGHTYFLHPWKGKLLAGTGHAPWPSKVLQASTHEGLLEKFIDDLNLVMPEAKLTRESIVRVHSGFLPATQDGGTQLANRPVIYDHGENGGAAGLFSVTGVKFTTARRVAEQALNHIFTATTRTGVSAQQYGKRPEASHAMTQVDYDWFPDHEDKRWMSTFAELISTESVHHLDDLVLRRTSLGDNPTRARRLAPTLSTLFDWSEERRVSEIKVLVESLAGQ